MIWIIGSLMLAIVVLLIVVGCFAAELKRREFPIEMVRKLRNSYPQPQTNEDALNFLFDHNITLRMVPNPKGGSAYSLWADNPNNPASSPYVAFKIRDCKNIDNFFQYYLLPAVTGIWKEIYHVDAGPVVVPLAVRTAGIHCPECGSRGACVNKNREHKADNPHDYRDDGSPQPANTDASNGLGKAGT